MTRERAKELLPILQAWSEGKTIQYYIEETDRWMDVRDGSTLDSDDCKHRIKPEPKLRPWKPEEVPVGCLIRIIGNPIPRALLTSVGRFGVVDGAGSEITLNLY